MARGCFVTFTAKEGQADAVVASLKQMKADMKANEPGNIFYDIYQRKKEPLKVFLMEKYAEKDDLRIHAESDHYAKNHERLGPLLDGDPVVLIVDEAD